MSIVDRYAPSPTSDLHLGNLRTALAGWLLTHRARGSWRLRVEDLDVARVRAAEGAAARQLRDLKDLGMAWDGEPVTQSERMEAYRDALTRLRERTYECFCTRREIEQAASAPHNDGYRPYPGTCARLSAAERSRRREERPAAIRVRAENAVFTVTDRFSGEVTATVDDFVLVRGDGVPAYNLASVVDDMYQGVTQVTRGADLLSSAPRQAWLTTQLGGQPPAYAHIGLVTNDRGKRLAKRDGAVTLADLQAQGWRTSDVLAELTASLGLGRHTTPHEALDAMPRLLPAAFHLPVTWTGRQLVSLQP
ncbi:tRNA glutamyl-Q(34) synthetase GluQRS [Arachnia rubra]|jgi:glutamyl-queuosine tRNA(asp) synthetase|uniref:tRNA glutamyl-Q(34) synthetase GluQRS n=1 Tax=Arachnia rubra TaxID=1547448 RepID=A0ABX7Y7S3_9ACTN|nr:tRNA glutamyl-Q(34) synthetase GluQRS [Arachnia rubra]MBB1572226.1 tRNA glutamyl-Q(34) synthetase GluQRS [Propionibacterium sp.]MDO4644980.1 tRNA glutamyl-Q(34) synthetase GluQRS [Propionibacteriaceae bacterium]MBB1576866.1 tRNA glutamyl-Q(34) synthetase GluQRS [Propionibacterium sp.]QUC09235.1 tRNA glutamyl-Q(34) synthetase GluQRS [Arachnia rubra]BCR80703.1 glutamyl-Q tRNA(Asp) synthetase [Arachnia rubra]